MDICNGSGYSHKCHDHEHIVHDGLDCPLCAALDLIKNLNAEIAELNRQNTRLCDQIEMCSDACEVCPSRFECVTTKKAQ